jgi:ligand-binding sensor domain-containing protein/signal transduction histidine kinase/DNA-binding response OmpR family regulator
LSNGRINCIAQDSTGFIWIGTQDGLNRYDGAKIKIFLHRPFDSTTITGNTINDLLCDGDNVWVAINTGISYYNARDEIFYNINILETPVLANVKYSVNKVFKDFKSRIFVATQRGVFVFNKPKNLFQKYIIPGKEFAKLNFLEITFITQDRDSIFWIGTHDLGVFSFDENKGLVKEIKHFNGKINTLLNNKIFSIYEDNHHTVWIGSNEGLYAVSKTNGIVTRYLSDPDRNNWLPHIGVNEIIEDSRNNLWLATNGGLSIFSRKDGTFVNYFHDDFDESSISNNSVHCIFEDFQHNIWIGSGENGINVIKSHTYEFDCFKRIPNKPNSLNYGFILSVIEDHLGNIWIGTNGKGINKFDIKTQKFQYFVPPIATKSGRQSAAILSLLEDNTGKIWMGTYLGGIVVFNPKTNQYTTYTFDNENPEGLSNNIVSNICQDQNGIIWIATNGGGVNIFEPLTNSFRHIRLSTNSISSDFCTFIYPDKMGLIWIGSYYGLNMYNPVTGDNVAFLHNKGPGSISSDVIQTIYEDSKNRLWIGTDFGLNLFNRKDRKFINYTTENGLPSNVINGILEDNRGFLWISTNNGLSRFDPEPVKVTNFDVNDGLASTVYYQGAYYKKPNGNLYFGGTEGLTYFNPDKAKHTKYKVPLVFTEFYIYNQPISPKQKYVLENSIFKTQKIVLNYDQTFIAIEFASLNYVNANKDNYSYFLDGFDRQWNQVRNRRTASYTNLPPGKYTFYVRALNENGNIAQNSLSIIVNPPLWETWYAYTFYVLLIFALLWLIYSYLHSRNVYRHNLVVERLEKEKAIEINQAKIRFFINVSHDFKTPLTLIVSPLEKLISKGSELVNTERDHLYHLMYRNTLRLSRLINQIMDLRKIDTGNIKLYVTRNDINAFIHEIALSFEEYAHNHTMDFTVNSKFDKLEVWFDVDKIEKVVYNILSNAFRYTHDGKSISISIEQLQPGELDNLPQGKYYEGFVKISVQDQGRGIPEDMQGKIFTRFYQVQTETLANPASSGVGLSIAREFVEMHQGRITVQSKLKHGSIFSVFLPLGKSHFKEEELAPEHSTDLIRVFENDIKPKEKPIIDEVVEPDENEGKSKYKLLIVEDNYELRRFLCDSLEQKYKVLEAQNGKDGFAITLAQFPDLVISDVMMPVMNGIELCKSIKNDVRVSHTPVILLTVLNSINNQIEGYEIGADDYITKPFNLNLLEARIINLIESRKKINRKFLEELKPNPKQYYHNLLDEKFIEKALDVVEKNISNTEFSAEDFASQIGMSRSNLHIKLKALTDQSATEFIRVTRLKKAIGFLSEYRYNISEVSYMVGFNSISYFNRCFKQQFGKTPSEFLNNGMDDENKSKQE